MGHHPLYHWQEVGHVKGQAAAIHAIAMAHIGKATSPVGAAKFQEDLQNRMKLRGILYGVMMFFFFPTK